MNNTESALFFELQKRLPQNYHIFPNMRLADVVDAINDGDYFEYKRRNNKIMPRHVDFIICDQNFKPNVAIELHGGYHNRNSQAEKDEEKKQILEGAGLPFVVVRVGDSFADSVEKVKSFLQ
jgi:very-short-patch-repair endonuclease